jgi:hypothetical protein
MDTAHPASRSHLFTVRVWREDLGHSQTEWRGEVRDDSGRVVQARGQPYYPKMKGGESDG